MCKGGLNSDHESYSVALGNIDSFHKKTEGTCDDRKQQSLFSYTIMSNTFMVESDIQFESYLTGFVVQSYVTAKIKQVCTSYTNI